jgi:ABC-2 type transport system permease protein
MLATLVRPYLAIFAARFSMLLQYRAAALAGIATQFWFGAIMVMALAAFYGSGRGAPSITLAQAITYIWLGQAFLGLLPWNVDTENRSHDAQRQCRL